MNKELIKIELQIASLEAMMKSFKEDVEELQAKQAQLAEADKPKRELRRGDYGLCYTGDHGWVITNAREQDAVKVLIYNGETEEWNTGYSRATHLGNIFDLLAGEPLTEFEYEGYTPCGKVIKVGSEGDIDLGSLRHIKKDDILEFATNLFKMGISAMKQGK